MATITVVAQVTAKSDAVDAVKSELLKMLAPTRQEEGCLEYRLHQDSDDPAVFVFYENWRSRTCLERHVDSPHYRAYAAAVGELLAGKTVRKMTEVG
jgi:quinol monooxygenase YgiN